MHDEVVMARPSEPVLEWLRKVLATHHVNTAELAKKSGIPRPRLRRLLLGSEPMWVDELLAITNGLQISAADFGMPHLDDVSAVPRGADDESAATGIEGLDAWGNQPEQLFRVAFALGCDLLFTAETAQLEESGLPPYVLDKYRDGQIPIELDAAFHSHIAPRYGADGITLTLSFDALYECTFPWSSIRRMVFSPMSPEPAAEPPSEPPPSRPRGPNLRLVGSD